MITGYQRKGALNEVKAALDVGVTTRKIYIHIWDISGEVSRSTF